MKEHVIRIKDRNGELNAFVHLFEEAALAVAAERDQQAQQGRFLGPLHGVPVSVTVQFRIQGKSSTINVKMHKHFVALEDAVVVDRIRKSGAVILGHTNVPRFLLAYEVWGDLYAEGKGVNCNAHIQDGDSEGLSDGLAPLRTGRRRCRSAFLRPVSSAAPRWTSSVDFAPRSSSQGRPIRSLTVR